MKNNRYYVRIRHDRSIRRHRHTDYYPPLFHIFDVRASTALIALDRAYRQAVLRWPSPIRKGAQCLDTVLSLVMVGTEE